MKRARFPLSSEQLELLIEFAKSSGLADLSRRLAKDSSVVSRRLQRLAECAPVIAKSERRWKLTEMGVQVNAQSEKFLEILLSILRPSLEMERSGQPTSALIIINAQKALLAPNFGIELNEPVANIAKLLNLWRRQSLPIFHVVHCSSSPESLFFRESEGFLIIDNLQPMPVENVIEKTHSSAFKDTDLRSRLENQSLASVVITGFTGNECIDATARDACELGYETTVVGDASASLGFYDKSGEFFEASRVHKLMLANIEALYGRTVQTAELLESQ